MMLPQEPFKHFNFVFETLPFSLRGCFPITEVENLVFEGFDILFFSLAVIAAQISMRKEAKFPRRLTAVLS